MDNVLHTHYLSILFHFIFFLLFVVFIVSVIFVVGKTMTCVRVVAIIRYIPLYKESTPNLSSALHCCGEP